MQIRIHDKAIIDALKTSAKSDGRSIPKQTEYLLKLVLGVKPKGLAQR